MKKPLVISAGILLAAAALYHSIYFEKLDARREKETLNTVNPKEMAEYFWRNKLDAVLETAIDLQSFDSLLRVNPQALVQQHGKAVGITSNYSFLVKGTAQRIAPEAEKIPVVMANGWATYYLLAKYIFGNTARDATGYFHIDDFKNTMDFNAVATELNSLILNEVVAKKLHSIPPGESLHFVGAVEMNVEQLPKEMTVVPLKLEVLR